MGAIDTANRRGHYIEVSPDAKLVNVYNAANHQCINNEQIPARIRRILNKKNATEAEQEEATFFCYRLGTKFRNTTKTERAFRKKNIILKSIFAGILCPVSFLLWVPVEKELEEIGVTQHARYAVSFFLISTPIYAIHTFFNNWFDRYCKKQNEEELDQETFHKLGLCTDTNYPHLLKKAQSPELIKRFLEGRKARKIITASGDHETLSVKKN